ncbi:MAG: glycerate kinase [Burkholderiaceae bacterium]|nr:glycerate kinase [Burkholderiaceae bacterium]
MKLDARRLLRHSFDAAVGAADPLRLPDAWLPHADEIARYSRTRVVGAGKAAASMAMAVERHWPPAAPLDGLVVTRYAHGLPCRRIDVVEAGHPVPDEAGERAAQRLLGLVGELGEDDLLVALMSGGGSSLLSLPVDEVPIGDLKTVTRALLASGAPIQDINVVRKHLSRIQGGRLAQATRARVMLRMISDVAGDDPSSIASGPCSPDPSRYADAIAVLERWHIDAPASVSAHLRRGARGDVAETPKPGDAAFDRVDSRIVATAHASLEAAAAVFERAGVRPVILGDTITGEARDVAQVIGAIGREIARYEQPFARPVALLSGGECTVTVRGGGTGGRCAEFLLALALELRGIDDAWAIAADTDGIDGAGENAGALLAPDTLARAQALGIDARARLDDNDAGSFFAALGDRVVTGPTRTNVNDYRALLLSGGDAREARA